MKQKYSFVSIIFLGLCFFEEQAQAQEQNQAQAQKQMPEPNQEQEQIQKQIEEKKQETDQEKEQQPAEQPLAPSEDKNAVKSQIKTDKPVSSEAQLLDTRENKKPGRGLRISGWTVLGVGYAASIGLGIALREEEYGKYFLIPFVGPLIVGMNFIRHDIKTEDDWDGFYFVAGVVFCVPSIMQLTGIGLLTAGYIKKKKYSVALSPVGPVGTAGLSVHGSFL